jgi:phosphoribosylformylglycinamidine cyclo-ligase
MGRKKKPSLSYRDAGVDIDAGEALVSAIKPIARATKRPGVLDELGGFGALFEIPKNYKEPILVSGTDGVGTKLKLAIELGIHDTIGIDLVAMCANDLIVQGAEPLFFLDYFATGKLDTATATAIMTGIGQGCQQAGAALIGGETAEMPGLYQEQDYDLAGFCVGVVEKSKIINGRLSQAGDVLIGLASSGVHSNGFSLVRKIIETCNVSLALPFEGTTLGAALLTPTRIYVKPVLAVLQQFPVHAICHVTGGGLPGNLPRVLADGLRAELDSNRWNAAPVFDWLQTQGNVEQKEMYRTFNCGIGLVLVVAADIADDVLQQLEQLGEQASIIGQLHNNPDNKERVSIS